MGVPHFQRLVCWICSTLVCAHCTSRRGNLVPATLSSHAIVCLFSYAATSTRVLPVSRHRFTEEAPSPSQVLFIPLQIDFKKKLQSCFQRDHAVPRWFAADCRLGVITLTLTANTAFSAEAYSCSLRGARFSEQSTEQRINLGLLMLHNLLRPLMDAQRDSVGRGHVSQKAIVDNEG